MSQWHDDDDSDLADDRDAPLESDLAGGDDTTAVVPCPECGREIADDADQCPYCKVWVVQNGGRPGAKGWTRGVAALLLLILCGGLAALLFWRM